ncbi:MAG: T9SS type A sorting domain-containing protein [Bacteroidales bacterium]|nr:T9SS type A sorting domain-containing protein [Bacteroidales bacterium]
MKNFHFKSFSNKLIPATIILSLFCLGLVFVPLKNRHSDRIRKNHEIFLSVLNKKAPKTKKLKNGKSADEPGMATFHDFLMTFDPATGKVPRERLITAYEQTEELASLKRTNSIVWQGYPSDMGGRTRAIMFDPNDPTHKKVWAGGVTGGLWYNIDITNAASPWTPVSDFWSNMAIRCLTYDPLNPQVFYIGTGEVETAMQTYRESSGLGFGIGRSTDGGSTWYHIPNTEQFAYVTDIVVRNENGNSVIYAGVASGLYKGSQHQSLPSDGLYRSADGGNSWQQVLPLIDGSSVPYCVSDIALGADNRIYVGTRPNLDGEGGAILLYSDDGFQWTVNSQYQTEILNTASRNIPGRVVLATAASDPNVVYALIASGYVEPSNGFNYFNCYHILRSADKGVSWTKKALPNNLTSGNNFATIAWHALDIAVDPNNSNALYIGGLDVHKSVNGGTSWIRVSDWAAMYSGGGPDYIHADQHIIVYKPGSSDELLFGCDGGVFYTANGSTYNPTLEEHNKGYSTLQFYSCALYPEAGINQFYGGLQDNGCLFYMGAPLTINDMVSGGDGAYCFYDKIDPSLSITSIYYNQYYIFVDGNFQNGLYNWSSGTFVSPADFDYKKKFLFCNAVDYIGNHQDQILRLSNLTGNCSGTFLSLNTGTTVFFSAVRYSPYSPTGKSTLFVGSESGRLFKITEAQGNSPVVTEIGDAAFPIANLSCIALGKSEDTLMVTFSNYGVPSVWQTYNGGQTWDNIEGNLPDMPVRWAIYHPEDDHQALLATETGVWSCSDLLQIPVEWVPVNYGMANVRVDMLQVRESDNTVMAATHGRGMFSMVWDVATGIAGKKEAKGFIYPNPTTGLLNISMPVTEESGITLKINNASGKEVLHQDLLAGPGKWAKQIDLTGYPRGIYFVTMKIAKKIIGTEKVLLY